MATDNEFEQAVASLRTNPGECNCVHPRDYVLATLKEFWDSETKTCLKFFDVGLTFLPDDYFAHDKVRSRLEKFVCKLTAISHLPDSLRGCEKLRTLDVRNNGLQSLPYHIGEWKSLEILKCDSNHRLEHLPESLGDSPSLKVLKATFCGLIEVPAALGRCVSLEELDVVGNCNLPGLPAELGGCPYLKVVHITGTPPIISCVGGRKSVLEALREDWAEKRPNTKSAAKKQ